MDTFKSDVVTINAAVENVYGKLSNPATLKNIVNIGNIPAEVKEKIDGIEFDADSISFNANPIGKMTLKIVERVELSKIVYSAVTSPIPMKAVINLEKIDDNTTKAVAELQMELNMFIRPMVEKPLTEGAKKFGELLAVLPYSQL